MRPLLATIVILLLAAPAHAAPAGQVPTPLWDLLSQLQQLYRQLWQWVSGVLDTATDEVREQLSPLLDTVHAARALGEWVSALARGMPSDVQWMLQRVAWRLQAAPAPRPGTGRAVVQQVATAAPDSEVAERARAMDRLSAETSVAVARARAAQATGARVAEGVVGDPTPRVVAEHAQQAARELAARGQATPSTRAAVQLLVEAFAASMDLQSRYHLDLVTRLNALVQQQVALGEQLTVNTERLAAAVELLNAEQKAELARQTTAAVAMLQQQGTAMEAVVAAAGMLRDRSAQQALYAALRELARQRP